MNTTKTEKFIVDLFIYLFNLFNKIKTYLITIYKDFKKEKYWTISTIILCLLYCPFFSLAVYEEFLYTSIIDFWLGSAFLLFFVRHNDYWWNSKNNDEEYILWWADLKKEYEEGSERSFRIFVFILISFIIFRIIPKLYEEFIKGVL